METDKRVKGRRAGTAGEAADGSKGTKKAAAREQGEDFYEEEVCFQRKELNF